MSAAVHAEGGDDLQIRVGTVMTHDSNLFRLAKGANAQALTGSSSSAETIRTSTLGLRYDKHYSLQRLEADVDVKNFDYQKFDYLNSNALNYRAAWHWAYTPHLHGTVSTSRAQALNNFLDFRSFRQRNERVDRTTRIDATYELDARWHLLGGFIRSTRHNELPIVQEADYKNRAFDAGLRYVMPSGSSISYTLQRTDGDLINRIIPSPGLSDRAYTQTDQTVQVHWAFSDKTSFNWRIGHRSRTHPTYPQRDFDGVVGGANLDWNISPVTSLVVAASSNIATYQSANTNYRRTSRLDIGPTWRLGTKTSLRAQVGRVAYTYDGDPGLQAPVDRHESVTTAGIDLGWAPYRYLSINASLQNSRRSANQPGLDFNANIFSLSAQLHF